MAPPAQADRRGSSYDIDFYRSSEFLAELSQALRINGAAIYFGSAGDTVPSRTGAKVLAVNADHTFRIGRAAT